MRYISVIIILAASIGAGLFFYTDGRTASTENIPETEENKKDFFRIMNYEVNKEIGKPFDLNIGNDSIAFSGEPVLYFRFSPAQCLFCIEHELGEIEKRQATLKSHCVLLPTYKGQQLNVLLGKHNLNIPMIYLPDSVTQTWGIEDFDTPYYFIAKDGKVISFFLPEKALPEETDAFLESFDRLLN